MKRTAQDEQGGQIGSIHGQSQPIGTVGELSGSATVMRGDGSVHKLDLGTPIYKGDIIETDADGSVNLRFSDDSTFAISQNARMTIDEYVFDPNSGGGETSVSILRGAFVFISGMIGRADPDSINIDTPVGSIGIRGTTILGLIDPDGESQITVVEGAIVIKNQSGEITLSEQYETATLTGDSDPIRHDGVLSAEEVAGDYTVLRTVSADLFSTFDDSGDDSGDDTGSETGDGEYNIPETDSDLAPATEERGDAGGAEQDETQLADSTNGTDDSGFLTGDILISFDENFDESAGVQDPSNTAPTTTTQQIATTTQTTQTTQTISGTTTQTTTTQTTTSERETQLPPELLVAPEESGTGTGVIAPPTIGGGPINLNNVIPTGTADGIKFIAAPYGVVLFGGALTNLAKTGHVVVSGEGETIKILTSTGGVADTVNTGGFYTSTNNLTLGSIGDLNGDGVPDFIIGAPFSDDGAATVVINYGTPTVIDISGFSAGDLGGYSVAGIGDFNGDGLSDIVIGGAGSFHLFLGSSIGSWVYNTDSLGVSILNGYGFTATDTGDFGKFTAGIGDINNSGYSDLAVSNASNGTVRIYFGRTEGSPVNFIDITGIPVSGGHDTIPVFGLGHVNNDGLADFAIMDTPNDKLHIFHGKASWAAPTPITASNLVLSANAGYKLIGANSIGDFNGNGFDDVVLAFRNGSTVEIFVVYGGLGPGNVNVMTLNNDYKFHMTLDLASPQFNLADPTTDPVDINFTAAGDLNKDGFHDFVIGIPQLLDENGGVLYVDGRAEQADIDSGKVKTATISDQDNQTLIGTSGADIFQIGSSHTNISVRGGNGNDTININGGTNSIGSIDGGAGIDTIHFTSGAMIDLSNIGGRISNVEKFLLGGTAQTLKLGADDLFRLLQESANGDLWFDSSSSGTLSLTKDGTPKDMSALGFSDGGSTATHDIWTFGAYTVHIDQNITVDV